MTSDEVRDYVHNNPGNYLHRDKSGKGYVCPVCGSGTGKNGTGMTTTDGVHFVCWANNCFGTRGADVLDIIGAEYGLTDYGEKINRAAEIYGLTIDKKNTSVTLRTTSKPREVPKKQPEKKSEKQPETDYTEFFLRANKDLDKTDYHRGISVETLNRFGVGYVAEWRHPKVPEQVPTSPRLIIPTSKTSYLARDTRQTDAIPEPERKYKKSKVGEVHIFNADALQNAKTPIFIVEGEIDALSVIDIGGEAIALGSVNYRQKFVDLVKKNPPKQPLILALDNDKAGRKCVEKLVPALTSAGVISFAADISAPAKDANELLNTDAERLRENVRRAESAAAEQAEQLRAAAIDELKQESAGGVMPDFIRNIENSKTAPHYSTGFNSLDKILDGGLYAGLYCIGAITSLGKTTFALQLADNIAVQGQDILFFSLEMARDELIAKSVSRLTLLKDLEEYKTTKHAKTTRGILNGRRWEHYGNEEKQIITDAMREYQKYADNIYISEGVGNIGVQEIRERVERQIKITGRAPVVVVDYLQIISPAEPRATDKQNTDRAVMELKRLSRDFTIPVIGISSFNRENYSSPVGLSSFKESGAVEYSSDVLIGLQYAGMDYADGEGEKDRKERIREIFRDAEKQARDGEAQKVEVKILKNRNGARGGTALDFYPLFNYFRDGDGVEDYL